MKEALRYLENARAILRSVPIEDGIYLDIKPVQEAFAIAYLAILRAIDAYLLKTGLDKKELPKSVDGYRGAIRKYLTIHDGKLIKEFDSLYGLLHIAGYYRGLLNNVAVVKESLKSAKNFIDKIK